MLLKMRTMNLVFLLLSHYNMPIIICDHSLCPFSAKNVRFVHGLLILSIMLDKIIKSNFGVR